MSPRTIASYVFLMTGLMKFRISLQRAVTPVWRIVVGLFVLCALGPALQLTIAAEPVGQGEPLWDLGRLDAAPAARWGKAEGLVQEVYFRGEPFKGRRTSVFAYVGRPEGLGPFPGVVLVHGGGGQAFRDWADHWARRGYVSIAMDTAGNGPGKSRLEDGGPGQDDATKFRDFDSGEIRDMWTYHAVADVILAHSLLRSLPEVDRERTALTGISWGGYLTCIAAGVDMRFKAAVPVYGCGFLHDNSVWKDNGSFARMGEDTRRLWIRHFDPGQYGAQVAGPILFLNGTNDFAYPLDSYRKTIERMPRELATVAIHHQLKHGHYWDFSIVDAFIDSVLLGGTPLARLGDVRIAGNEVLAPILTGTPLAGAELWFTADTGRWQEREWKAVPATVTEHLVRAELPDQRPLSFFLQGIDARGLRTSTTHAGLLASDDFSNPAMVPTPRLEQDFYDWHKRHAEVLVFKDAIEPDIVLIGDSITHLWGGVPPEPGRANGAQSWEALFGARALNLGFGWDRTQNVLWRIDHGELDGLNPGVVVIHIGTNNLAETRHHAAATPLQIAGGIRAVGQRVRGRFPQATIVLMAVFPRGESPDHPLRRPIAGINALLPAIAREIGAELVDISEALLDEDGSYSRAMAPDFLHPSAKGYAVWAEALKPFVDGGR